MNMKLPFRPVDISAKPTKSCQAPACISGLYALGQLGLASKDTIDAFHLVQFYTSKRLQDDACVDEVWYIQWLFKYYLPWRDSDVGKKLMRELDTTGYSRVSSERNLYNDLSTVKFSILFQMIYPTTTTEEQAND